MRSAGASLGSGDVLSVAGSCCRHSYRCWLWSIPRVIVRAGQAGCAGTRMTLFLLQVNVFRLRVTAHRSSRYQDWWCSRPRLPRAAPA
jgi:hypothetical protein